MPLIVVFFCIASWKGLRMVETYLNVLWVAEERRLWMVYKLN